MTTWAKQKQYYKANRKKLIEQNTEYKVINRDRHYAHKHIYSLLKSKEIKKPLRCPSCGSKNNIEAYYIRFRPYIKFDWGCRSCNQKRRYQK